MPTIDRIAHLTGPLRITCNACGHQALWSKADAARRLGGESTTTDARRHLKCSACGERRPHFFGFSV